MLPPYCNACKSLGEDCKGGGNKNCIKRNPLPSVIVGILDTYGGLRVVVTQRKRLRYHVRHDELAVIVPRLRVHEPIAWGDIPIVIRRAEIAIDNWIARRGIPNDPLQREIVTMYRLRGLEYHKQSRDLAALAYT